MKKFLAILALSTALTVVPATPAKAAAFIGGVVAFAATPLGGFVINAGIGLALSLGGPLIADWLGLDKGDQTETHESLGARTVATVGENIPRSFLYGHAATGGHFLYHNAWSGAGQTPNNHYVQVFSLGDLPISEYKQLWGDKRKRTIDWGSSTSKGYPVEESLVNGRYNQWAIFRDGTDATADAYLLDKFGADPDYPWTAKMIGVGVPMIIITTRLSKGFFDGTPHEFLHEVEGASFHDLREDVSMGGTGTHVYGTESTYETTRNNMVIASNLVRGITYNGQWFYGGQNVGPWRTPAAAWMAAANACDTSVSKKGGGIQPRFEIGGEISVDQPPLRFLEEIMKSSTGRMAEVAGAYIPTIGGGGSSVYGFSEKDFVITRDQSAEYLAGLENKFNAYTLVYPEPKKAWNDRTVHRTDAAMVASDGGRTLPVEIRLPLVNDSSRAQRIATGAKREGRRVIVHAGVLPFNAFTLTPNDIVSFTHSKFQYTNKKFRVVTKGQPAGFLSPVVLKEVDPDDLDVYDPEADEEDFAAEVLTTKNAPVQTITAPSAVAFSIKDANGNPRRLSILYGWDAELDDVDAVLLEAKLPAADDNDLIINTTVAYKNEAGVSGSNTGSSSLVALESYKARLKYITNSGRETSYSGWLSLTMLDIKLGIADFDPVINEAREYANTALRQLNDEVNRIASGQAAQDFANFADKQTIRQEFRSQTDDAEAGFVQQLDVATSDISALAQLIVSLTAALGGGTSFINVQYKVLAAPVGYAARYGIVAGVDDGSLRSATFMIDVPLDSNDPTRIVMQADQTVFLNSAGDLLALFDGDELNTAIIPNLAAEKITAGTITSVDELSFWDLDTGAFRNST